MEIQDKWKTLFQEMLSLNGISFNRSLMPPDAVSLPVLCVFSDASEDAFGACAYARWQLSNGKYDMRFIAAKSRVAPLKRLTIPRLELQGAVLASRLSKTIVEQCRFQFEKTVLFMDSKIVLAWICSEARRFKPFVSIRVGEIQSNTDPAQWRHIPGELNVADDVSRGIPATSLVERWKHGPKFLYLPEEEWPHDSSNVDQSEVEGESRKVHTVFIHTKEESPIDCTKFSSWRRLIRVTAYILRVVWNLRTSCHKNKAAEKNKMKPKEGPLSPERVGKRRESLDQRESEKPERPSHERRVKESKSLHRFRWHRPSWWPRRQGLSVLRNQASRVTPQRTLDIAPHHAPCTPVWAHSDSNNGREDKKKVLDPEGPRSGEISEI